MKRLVSLTSVLLLTVTMVLAGNGRINTITNTTNAPTITPPAVESAEATPVSEAVTETPGPKGRLGSIPNHVRNKVHHVKVGKTKATKISREKRIENLRSKTGKYSRFEGKLLIGVLLACGGAVLVIIGAILLAMGIGTKTVATNVNFRTGQTSGGTSVAGILIGIGVAAIIAGGVLIILHFVL